MNLFLTHISKDFIHIFGNMMILLILLNSENILHGFKGLVYSNKAMTQSKDIYISQKPQYLF